MIHYSGPNILIVLIIITLSLTFIPSLDAVLAKFKVIVEIDNVNSFSGVHKIKVKLDNGDSKTRYTDLGQLANEQDESDIRLKPFVFSHSPKTFTACLSSSTMDKECIKGFNSPAKVPEYVRFVLP